MSDYTFNHPPAQRQIIDDFRRFDLPLLLADVPTTIPCPGIGIWDSEKQKCVAKK